MKSQGLLALGAAGLIGFGLYRMMDGGTTMGATNVVTGTQTSTTSTTTTTTTATNDITKLPIYRYAVDTADRECDRAWGGGNVKSTNLTQNVDGTWSWDCVNPMGGLLPGRGRANADFSSVNVGIHA